MKIAQKKWTAAAAAAVAIYILLLRLFLWMRKATQRLSSSPRCYHMKYTAQAMLSLTRTPLQPIQVRTQWCCCPSCAAKAAIPNTTKSYYNFVHPSAVKRLNTKRQEDLGCEQRAATRNWCQQKYRPGGSVEWRSIASRKTIEI